MFGWRMIVSEWSELSDGLGDSRQMIHWIKPGISAFIYLHVACKV